jgi:hypothetical protein
MIELYFLLFRAVFLVALVYFSFTFLAPFGFFGAIAVTGIAALVEFVSAAATAFSPDAPIDRLKIVPPPPRPPGSPTAGRIPEPAYGTYFFGPVLRDSQAAATVGATGAWERVFGRPRPPVSPTAARPRRSLLTTLREWRQRTRASRVMALLSLGPYLAAYCGLAAGFAAAIALSAVVCAVFLLCLGFVIVGTVVAAGVLRGVEAALLWARGITVECPDCHRPVTRPEYSCPHCPPSAPSIHRRLLPGRLGVLQRVCRCGNALPTLLARGKWKLPSYCQHCHKPLPTKALSAATFHAPVAAGSKAGKTVYMMSAVARMEIRGRDAGDPLEFEFADQAAKRDFLDARRALESGTLTAVQKTQVASRPRAFNVFVGPDGPPSRRLLYLYDAAGESYERSTGLTEFRFFGLTTGIVFVVDPFSLPAVRRLAAPAAVQRANPSLEAPESVLERLAQSLRENRRAKADRRLPIATAVVVTKGDALFEAGGGIHPYEGRAWATAAGPGRGLADNPAARTARSAAVREWLETAAGQRSLVANIDNTFSQTRFYVVSGLDAFVVRARRRGSERSRVRNDDPLDPLLWLMDAAGRKRGG